MATEKFANAASSTLNGGISAGSSSLVLADGSLFPSAGQFRILIDSEIILVGSRSGTTCSSLTRGAEGTTAASHSSGATVTQILTAAALLNVPLAMTTQGDLPTLDSNGQQTRIAAPADGSYVAKWVSKVLTWVARGMTTAGDIEYMGASNPARLAAPADGNYGINWATAVPSWYSLPNNALPPGVVLPYGGASAPSGYLLCDGSAVSRTTYSALFAILSTTYGVGNGSTTFNLPDLRQRFPIGKAASGTGATLGSTGGNIDHTHSTPDHQHGLAGHTHTFTTSTASLNHHHDLALRHDIQLGGGGTGPDQSSTTGDTDVSHNHTGTTAGNSGNTDAANGGATGSANPPFQVFNFIVKT